MKRFISQNWYKLLMSISAILFSIGFLVFATKFNTSKAGEPDKNVRQNDHVQGVHVVGTGDGIYEVYWDITTSKYVSRNIRDITY